MALPEPLTTEADVHAWRALVNGIATKDQQIRVLAWLQIATNLYGTPLVSGVDGERDTLVLIGRHQIGTMIGNMQTQSFLELVRAADIERARAKLEPLTVMTTPRGRRINKRQTE